ncbi:host cell division inhibitor Icd-like protein [Enterobacter ludwigii]|uniref:host cell division inhibitor Icd-like protein n=1 Tax=Enterobacter ludwigii TaxID=299767 RepID=UPI000643A0B1|nr:host cell division inhibitor Icd-like protein [Enterobacter ludwigii]KLP39504.1 hypothetical protein ABR36_10865 [Enterobacter ludwigii]
MSKFTWLFIATYADPKAIPVVVRTQADTEEEARQQLDGGFTLTFAAKIRTESPFNICWNDMDNMALWSITSTDTSCARKIAGSHHA